MQGDSLEVQNGRPSVLPIAHDGISDRRKMYPDLVSPAGQREGSAIAEVFVSVDELDSGACFLKSFAIAARDRRIHRKDWSAESALNETEIRLLDDTGLKKVRISPQQTTLRNSWKRL
jgi:hypothetical protein